MNFFQASFSVLQKIGKALMLPVSVLPIAGLLLGLGKLHIGFLPPVVSDLMANSGDAIFGSLPLIFAIATAVGLAGNDGVAALAATVGYVVLLATLGVMAEVFGVKPKAVMGFQTMETGVFGGILVGALAAWLFNRYYRIQLPQVLSFFSGKRFVPIVTALSALVLGLVLSVAWPPVQRGIDVFSHAVAYGNPTIGATIYGFVERLLLPFGLHHIWNVPFFYEIGSFTDAAGKTVHGDTHRFFAGDPTAGILGGAFLFKMWGLPAAAMAIWHTARPENRAKVGSIMVSAAVTSFLFGITEPIEFSFLFVAPALYFVHACLAAAGQALFGLLGAKLGFTFSQGFFDYVLYFPLSTKPWLVLVFGPLWGLLYYGVFRFMIVKFNLRTPGREDEAAETSAEFSGGEGLSAAEQKAVELVKAFGGRGNIVNLDACITRLRVDLKEVSRASPDRLKALGATGVLSVGTGLQAVFGPSSENLKSDMDAAIRRGLPGLDQAYSGAGAGTTSAAEASPIVTAPGVSPEKAAALAQAWLPLLGGRANIAKVEACAGNRLRLELKDPAAVKEEGLREADLPALMRLKGNAVHLVVSGDAGLYQAVLARA